MLSNRENNFVCDENVFFFRGTYKEFTFSRVFVLGINGAVLYSPSVTNATSTGLDKEGVQTEIDCNFICVAAGGK